MMKEISIKLSTNIVYVSGRVNDEDYTFTLSGTDGESSIWTTQVPRVNPDIYRCEITAIDTAGKTVSYNTVLYYGLNLITDRTAGDVEYVKSLNSLGISEWTESQTAEYLAGLKGAYNATDLNRVESAVAYLMERLQITGFYLDLDIKNTWIITEFFNETDMKRYLSNIQTLRDLFVMPEETPEVPETMQHFTYDKANDIEQILEIIDQLISNISANFIYSGEVYAGEVMQ